MKTLLLFLLALGGASLSAQTVLQRFAAVSSGAGTVSDMDLPQPTTKGSVIITMPMLLSPDVKVTSVTDNAPDGGNTYKQVPGTVASCAKQALDIWYCENCNPGATELKFHLSGHVRASLNTFVELSDMALTSVLDGNGAHVSDGTATKDGVELGPKIQTTAKDFVIARYFSAPPLPKAVTPATWTYTTSFVYAVNASAGTYQPTLTGGKAAGNFCIGMAAFKTAPPDAAGQAKTE